MADELTFATVSIPPRFVMALSSLSTIPANGGGGGDKYIACNTQAIPDTCRWSSWGIV